LGAVAVALLLAVLINGCRPRGNSGQAQEHELDEMPQLSAVPLVSGSKLQVVATTSIVADVVQQVGGSAIDLVTLLPPGTDPHTFEPTPQNAVAIADAHVVLINGAGLEEFLEPLLENTGGDAMIVPVSHGVELLQLGGEPAHDGDAEEEGSHEHEDEDSHEHEEGGADPHTWFDPNNVIVWTENIEHALSTLDPANAETYSANAGAYKAQLQELDTWISTQLGTIRQDDRKLVTDHTTFSYFAHRYGFEQVGSVFPGYSTLDAPSAKERVALEEAIRELGVSALFVSTEANPDLAQRIAEDTGVNLVFLYSGSLSEPGGPADSYLALMRYNVSAIAEALR
jgi:ABC-type Zn uptake system ZnuABC Zn-binding protein ZnuA